jgi:hypothetical protein
VASIAWQGLKNVVTVAFMPVVKELAIDFAGWVSNSTKMKADIKEMGADLLHVLERAGNVFETIERVMKFLKVVGGVALAPTNILAPILDAEGKSGLQRRMDAFNNEANPPASRRLEIGHSAASGALFMSPELTGQNALSNMANSLGGAQVSH